MCFFKIQISVILLFYIIYYEYNKILDQNKIIDIFEIFINGLK